MRRPKGRVRPGGFRLPDSGHTTIVSSGTFTGQAVHKSSKGTTPLPASPPRQPRKLLPRSSEMIVFVIKRLPEANGGGPDTAEVVGRPEMFFPMQVDVAWRKSVGYLTLSVTKTGASAACYAKDVQVWDLKNKVP